MTENKVSEIKTGTKVMKDGFEGTVTKVCDWDENMVEVKIRSGLVCVGKSTFSGQYENNYIIKI